MEAVQDHTLRISEAAQQLGVSAQYLRLLESQGRIPRARRIFGCRIFGPEDIARLKAMGVGSQPRRLRRAEDILEESR
jgi:DNA-binding transcriptional MerR regulator